jgi:hypothetical protein
LFGSCIIHILNTGCAKIKKKKSGAKGLNFWAEVWQNPTTEINNIISMEMDALWRSVRKIKDGKNKE